jgi:hypothetical protein
MITESHSPALSAAGWAAPWETINLGPKGVGARGAFPSLRGSSRRRRQNWISSIGAEVAISRGKILTKAIPVFVGIGLVLSARSANTDYGPPSYAYYDPIRGSSNPDFGYWDGWRGQTLADFGDGQFGGHVPPPY